MIQYAKEELGYQYVWASTERQNTSHTLNQALGYTPLTVDTEFKASPVFISQKNNALIEEYNVGSRQLCWLETSKVD